MKSAILLSGGMDSLSLAWWKRPNVAFTIDYGQRAAKTEIAVSKKICEELKIEHHVINVDLSALGSGDLLGGQQNVNAPSTDWWPYRNQTVNNISSDEKQSH